jgi:hypothetical protein
LVEDGGHGHRYSVKGLESHRMLSTPPYDPLKFKSLIPLLFRRC